MTSTAQAIKARQNRERIREHLLARVLADQPPAPRPVRIRPAFPPTLHEFTRRPDLGGIETQCQRCFGWRDDPRHFTPMPQHALEP